MFKSIKTKLGLFVAGVVFVSVGLVSFFIVTRQKEQLVQEIKLRGLAIVRNLSANSKIPLWQQETLTLASFVKDAVSNPGVRYAFISDEKGIIVAHNILSEVGKPIKQQVSSGTQPTSSEETRMEHIWSSEGEHLLGISEHIFRAGVWIGSVYVGISHEFIDKAVRKTYLSVILIASGIIFLSIIASYFLTSIMVKPVKELTSGAKEIGKGNLDYKISIKSKDEIGTLAQTFNQMTASLKKAEIEMVEKERMKQELTIAQEIQKSLLPNTQPDIKGYKIGSLYQASFEVGGDYYDFIPLKDSGYGIALGDVSGKGVPAALVMAVTRTILRFQALNSMSTAEVLKNTNSILYEQVQRGIFVTMFYIIIDLGTSGITASCAGHNPALIIRSNGAVEWLKPAGSVLGFVGSKLFDTRIQEVKINLSKDDLLLIYSDGVTEAMNEKQEEFGENRLLYVTLNSSKDEPNKILEKINNELNNFCGQEPQHDDITMVVVKGE